MWCKRLIVGIVAVAVAFIAIKTPVAYNLNKEMRNPFMLVWTLLSREQTQALNREWMLKSIFLGLAVSALILTLVLLLKQRNQIILSMLPEDCVADLIGLHQQLQKSEKPKSIWLIRGIMLWNICGSLWAFQVHIKLENLFSLLKKALSKR